MLRWMCYSANHKEDKTIRKRGKRGEGLYTWE